MENNIELLKLTKAVFWNIDISKLDYLEDKNIIIKRIIEAGLENDEIIMWQLYSYEDIKNIAINIENLRKDQVIYMAFVLNIKEEDFICYLKKPWNKK